MSTMQYDRFSHVAEGYARYRPVYPDALYTHILSHTTGRGAAWDAGTGNGQVASVLAKQFAKVYATDISAQQIAYAAQSPNIDYIVCAAEHSNLPAQSIDLITVAQAVHWFDPDAFAREVARTAAPGAVLAIWGYGLLSGTPEIDRQVHLLYDTILDGFWDPHRRMVDEGYAGIRMPFEEIACPAFSMSKSMDAPALSGYLRTWSAAGKYRQHHGSDPVILIEQAVTEAFAGGEIVFHTPVFLKMWRIHTS